MKAIGIVCSPRKHGNSDVLVREILKFTGSENFEVFYPNEMNIRGCQACHSCKEQGKCAVKDDMQEIYEGIEKSDVIVFGTPIYMAGTAAQFKLVLDRLFAFLGPAPKFESRIPKGKKAALVISQGYENVKEYETHINQMKEALLSLGFDGVEVLQAPGLNELGEAVRHDDLMQEARKIGQALGQA